MDKQKFYTSGEFAKMAGVSIRTVRYYDSIGILKPTHRNESGYRLYDNKDFVKLKKILALKYLGLSLDEILSTEESDFEKDDLLKSLKLQKNILINKINKMKVILNTIDTAEVIMEDSEGLDWEKTIDVIKCLESEKEILQRSRDVSNLNERIKLEDKFSTNEYGWYEWVFNNINFKPDSKILEIGCGNGALWVKNMDKIQDTMDITLIDICEDMINDTKNNLKDNMQRFTFGISNLDAMPYKDNTFDIVIANHILFFMKDVHKVLREIERILKPGGYVYCSTIGKMHMKELQELILGFSNSIHINEDKLCSNFGIENGKDILKEYFEDVEGIYYNNVLLINDTNSILEYIYSIPGNILDIIDTKKKEFESYIKRTLDNEGSIAITGSKGMFTGRKKL